jgi:hypothetical protein
LHKECITREEEEEVESVILLLRFLFEIFKSIFEIIEKRKARRINGEPPPSA